MDHVCPRAGRRSFSELIPYLCGGRALQTVLWLRFLVHFSHLALHPMTTKLTCRRRSIHALVRVNRSGHRKRIEPRYRPKDLHSKGGTSKTPSAYSACPKSAPIANGRRTASDAEGMSSVRVTDGGKKSVWLAMRPVPPKLKRSRNASRSKAGQNLSGAQPKQQIH